MLESSVLSLAQAPQVPAVVPIAALIVSVVSLALAGISLFLTYQRDRREKQRDRKKVDIVSSIENRALLVVEEKSIEASYYCCTVTNAGVPGVKIRRVGLRSHGNAGVEIPLQRAQGQEDGVLAQGDSQVWLIALEDLQASLSGPSPTKVVAVATDTAGDQYVQDRSKSVPIPLKD